MSKDPFYSPATSSARSSERTPEEPLWRLRKGAHTRQAALRDHGKWGIEFCLFMNGRFHFGQRFNLREEAIAAASQAREALASDGWA